MGFDIDNLLKKDEFQKLGKERIGAFQKLAAELSGKSGPEALPILMRFQKEMPKEPAFSKEEQTAMLEILLASLSPEEKEKYQAIFKYFG